MRPRRSPYTALRRSSRPSVRLNCQVVRERDFQLVADRIVNLSASGLMVMPADPVLTGERLLVSFQLPRSGTWIDAEATVARVVHGRRPGEYTRGLALELEGAAGIAQLLSDDLAQSPPAPPGNRPGRRALLALTALFS
jgi:hypothetical protein